MLKVKFKEWNCIVNIGRYAHNDRTSISLIDEEDGQPVATATINIPEIPVRENQALIKDYSENAGMLKLLVDAEIIGSPIGEVKLNQYGDVAYLCEVMYISCDSCKEPVKKFARQGDARYCTECA